MASSMAAAAAHSMPPFPLPAVPRVRPPPIPKGTPGPNTLPQPGAPPKPGLIWVDGRWASPNSRSAKHKREVVSKHLEKALQHEVHGMNIYAYKHLRSHQVVYSLTKNMDNTKIIKQLLYHGKKTVPAALRRDVWRPYFSVHFPRTPAGAMKGLRVFQELRELSALRQLSPPREMAITTQKDIDNMKKSYDPSEWEDKTENEIKGKSLLEVPVVGERLPARMLARRLMNQAATSVADVAAVLTRESSPRAVDPSRARLKKGKKDVEMITRTPQQQMERTAEKRIAKEEALSIRAHNRLLEIRKTEGSAAERLERRQQYLNVQPGMVEIDQHTKDRISIEYDGVENNLALIEEADQATQAEIGATEALRIALEQVQAEKCTQRENIESTISAEVEQRLNLMTQAERDQIEKEVEAERAQKQSTIDAEIAAVREEVKIQRAELYERPSTAARTKALRKLTREGHARIFAMKTELRTRHLKWAGPFASITAEVDKAMANIDADWETRLSQLRSEVEAEKQNNADPANHEVEIRWANVRDGTYAKSWPNSVFHTELQPKAVSKEQNRAVTTHFHLDIDEEPIETQYGVAERPRRNTVHVFGSVAPDMDDPSTRDKGRYQSPTEIANQQMDTRAMRVQEWANTETILVRDRILGLRAQSRDLERLFAGIALDREACPSIDASFVSIERAQTLLEEMDRRSYKPSEIEEIVEHVNYVRDMEPFCVDEIPNSPHPLADEARIKFAQVTAEYLALESQNIEARHQANMREAFLVKFDEREKLEDSIGRFKGDANLHADAVRELRSFDVRYPFVNDTFSRRDSLAETLQSEIEDGKAEVTRLEDELQASSQGTGTEEEVLLQQLRDQLTAEADALKLKVAQLNQLEEENSAGLQSIRDAARNDRKAWIEFKTAGGLDAYEGGLGSYGARDAREKEVAQRQAEDSSTQQQSQGMVMEQPKSDLGRWGRFKKMFSRR